MPPYWIIASFLVGMAGCAGPERSVVDRAPGVAPERFERANTGTVVDATPGSPSPLDTEDGVTLTEAVAAALARHPRLRAAERERAARVAEVHQASRRPNPFLTLELEDFAGSDDFSGVDGAQATVWVGTLLERGGKRAARSRVAEVSVDLADLGSAILAHEVAARTSAAFWSALAAQDELELARTTEETAGTVLEAVTERVAAGKVSPVEERKYAVAYASARLGLAEAERSWDWARRALARTWAGEADFEAVEGRFASVAPPVPFAELEERLAESPRVRLLDAECARSAAAAELAASSSAFDWELRVGVRRFEETDDTAAVVALDVPLGIFDRKTGALRAARERRMRSEHDGEATRLDLTEDLATAWTRMAGAYEEAVALESDILPDARQVFAAVGEGYREGKFVLIDLLDAQRTFFDARGRHMRAVATYHLAATEIERLICGPMP